MTDGSYTAQQIVSAVSAIIVTTGLAIEMHPLLTQPRPKPAAIAARLCLWAGTVGLWVAAWINAHSRRSVIVERVWSPSDFLVFWIALVFTVLSAWRHLAGRRANALLALVWFAGLCVLAVYLKGFYFN